MDEPQSPRFFTRSDPTPDPLFYSWPRFVTHIDDDAVAAVGALYDELGLRFMRATRCIAPAAVELLAGDPGAAAEELRWGYQALEASRSVDTVLLDKTGTLTTGMMQVTAVQPAPGTSREELLRRLNRRIRDPIAAPDPTAVP